MAVPQIDVADFVSVSVQISPLAVPFLSFGIPMIAGDSNVIDTGTRFRTYTTINQVAADFGTTAPEYLAANVFFAQTPTPAQAMIGRWASAAVAAVLHGATLSTAQQAIGNFTPVASGSLFIIVNGIPLALVGVNFSAQLNLNGVASQLQTVLAAASAGSTVVFNAPFSRFDITSGVTGVNSSVSYGAPPTAVGSISFTGNPSAGDTVTLNGTAITFVASGPVGNQVLIGASAAATAANFLAFVQASQDAQIVKFLFSMAPGGTIVYPYAATSGAAGNALTLTKVSTNITLSGATLAGASGTDISTLMGLTAASGAGTPGIGAGPETPLQCAVALASASAQWYGLSFCATAPVQISDHIAVANYILASPRLRMYGVSTTNSNVLNPAVTTDVASQLQALQNKRVFVMYSSSNAYSALTMMGRAYTVNFAGSNTTITLAYKQAPGIASEFINETQFATLIAKGANAEVAVDNGAFMIWPGQMSNGYWFDEVHGVDWLANHIQTDVFNLLYQSTTKIPQTDAGNHTIATVIEASCGDGITNGLGAGGVWQAAGFGALNQGDTLTKGFYVYYPLIATQSPADRQARKSVPFQVAFKLAGAVHTVGVILNINR